MALVRIRIVVWSQNLGLLSDPARHGFGPLGVQYAFGVLAVGKGVFDACDGIFLASSCRRSGRLSLNAAVRAFERLFRDKI